MCRPINHAFRRHGGPRRRYVAAGGNSGRRTSLRPQSQRPGARSLDDRRLRRRLHEPGAHAEHLVRHHLRSRRLHRRQPDHRRAHLLRARRLRLPHRLGRARRLDAALRRRVHLQLAHRAPHLRHRPELRRRHDLADVDLRAGAPGRRPGADHHLQLPGLDGSRRVGGQQRLDHLLPGHRLQHHRLPLRRLRHQDLRAHAEGRSCSSASAAASPSAWR